MVYSTCRFSLRMPYVILFLYYSVLLVLRLPRLGKRDLILLLFVRLFDLRLFGFVCFLFLLVSGMGCVFWLWHSLDFSLIFFYMWRFLCLFVSHIFFFVPREDLAYVAITKTRLLKYTENFTTKTWKLSDKNSDIFHISAQNIDCGYLLEPPRWGGSNEYPPSMILSRNKKVNVYPSKPQFYCIKVGFKGV